MKLYKREWVEITETTYRMKVPFGWLVSRTQSRGHSWYSGASDAISTTLIFYFDPFNLWKLEDKPKEK
jgi:hypothetical protein